MSAASFSDAHRLRRERPFRWVIVRSRLHLGLVRCWKINSSGQSIPAFLCDRECLIRVVGLIFPLPVLLYRLEESCLDQSIDGTSQMVFANLAVFEFLEVVSATSRG